SGARADGRGPKARGTRALVRRRPGRRAPTGRRTTGQGRRSWPREACRDPIVLVRAEHDGRSREGEEVVLAGGLVIVDGQHGAALHRGQRVVEGALALQGLEEAEPGGAADG